MQTASQNKNTTRRLEKSVVRIVVEVRQYGVGSSAWLHVQVDLQERKTEVLLCDCNSLCCRTADSNKRLSVYTLRLPSHFHARLAKAPALSTIRGESPLPDSRSLSPVSVTRKALNFCPSIPPVPKPTARDIDSVKLPRKLTAAESKRNSLKCRLSLSGDAGQVSRGRHAVRRQTLISSEEVPSILSQSAIRATQRRSCSAEESSPSSCLSVSGGGLPSPTFSKSISHGCLQTFSQPPKSGRTGITRRVRTPSASSASLSPLWSHAAESVTKVYRHS